MQLLIAFTSALLMHTVHTFRMLPFQNRFPYSQTPLLNRDSGTAWQAEEQYKTRMSNNDMSDNAGLRWQAMG